VILEAGYTASGLATYGQTILPALAGSTRVCTCDRAGDGTSDPRPVRIRPLTGATQARELHRLLEAIQVRGAVPATTFTPARGSMGR
jgi:pimeloyl-ACP methyl ester carboxylesterase